MANISFEDILQDYSRRIVLKGIAGIWDHDTKVLHINTRLCDSSLWENTSEIKVYTVDDDLVFTITDLSSVFEDVPVLIDIHFDPDCHARIDTEYKSNKDYVESLGKIVISSTGCIFDNDVHDPDTENNNNYVGRSAWERWMLDGMDYLRRDEFPILNEYGGIKFNHDIKKEYSDFRILSPGATKYESAWEGDDDITGFRLIIPKTTKFIDFYGIAEESIYERHGLSRFSPTPGIKNTVSIKSVPGVNLHINPGTISVDGETKNHIREVRGYRIFLNSFESSQNIDSYTPAWFCVYCGNWNSSGVEKSNTIYIVFKED